jgi:hypothetical protein
VKINSVVLATPASITLERCLPYEFPAYSGKYAEQGMNNYGSEKEITKDLNEPRTFDCKLIFAPEKLFLGSPFKIEIFKAFVNYDYRIKQELSAEVVPLPKEPDDATASDPAIPPT